MYSIETNYGGYRFRSRLEARWAVFFDTAGIDFRYEPEGYQLPWRLTPSSDDTMRYLPDFWLPDLGLWAEVKGRWTDTEEWKFLNAAAALSAPDGGCNAAGDTGNDVVILGDTFRQPRRGSTIPYVLHMHKGLLGVTPWNFGRPSPCTTVDSMAIADDTHGDLRLLDRSVTFKGSLLAGKTWPVPLPSGATTALRVAQASRFEFGETPGGRI